MRGETSRRSNTMRQEPNPYMGITPPSTQKLNVLGLWVFFLICCSTFSFILYVRLKLTLWYLTISLSSENLSSTLIHSPAHLNGTHFLETFVRKTFDTGIKLHSSKSITTTNHRVWYHLLGESEGENTEEIKQEWDRAWPK